MKTNILQRIKKAISSVFFPVIVDEKTVNTSAGALSELSKEDLNRSYDDVRRASLLCERAVIIAGRRADLAEKQQMLKEKLTELERFEHLTDNEKEYITNILNKYKDVVKEKNSLRSQLSSFTRILDYLEPYEKDIPDAITALADAEDMQRRVKQDMNYIEGERAELEIRKVTIEKALVTVFRGSLAITLLFAALTCFMLFLYYRHGIEIFYYALYTAIATIVIATLLFIIRRRLIFESKLNVLLQIRAVELLNKKKLLYVHYTRIVNFSYKKYRVKSAYELSDMWKEYAYYKHVSARYSNMRNIAFAVVDELQAFLKANGLQKSKTSVESFEKILNFDNNKKQYRRFAEQLSIIEAKLTQMEEEQTVIWEELQTLKDNDTTTDNVIERMMAEHFDDLSNVIPIIDEDDEFDYSYDEIADPEPLAE